MALKKPVAKATTKSGKAHVSNGTASVGNFKDAFKKGKERAAQFKGGGDVQLEDGNYVCQLTDSMCNFTLDKKGNPVTKGGKAPGMRLGFVVINGEHKGKQPSSWTGLDREVAISILVQQLALLFECDQDDINLEDLPRMAKELSEAKPYVRLQAKNNEIKNGPRAGQTATNYIVRAVLDSDQVSEDDDE